MKNSLAILAYSILTTVFSINSALADSYAEDRAAILDLQGRYLFALDFRDAEAYASTFSEGFGCPHRPWTSAPR